MDCSSVFYSEDAGGEALVSVLSDWRACSPEAGVLLLVAEANQSAVPALQQCCRDLDLPLIGGIFPELIWRGQFFSHGVLALRFEHMPRYLLLDRLSQQKELAETCAQLQNLVAESDATSSTLFLIFDALYPWVSSLLDELYLSLGSDVRYLGVNAGSETFQSTPCLFDQQRFVEDAVLALLLPDHPGGVLEHGYHVPESFTAATAAAGNRVSSIDWRPAFDVYAELAQKHYGVEVTRENFYQCGVHFPLGIIRADGEVLVRIPVGLEDDGSVYCVGEVPENAVLALLQAVDADSEATIGRIAEQAGEKVQDVPLMTFYCAGRRMHMGPEAIRELASLQQRVSGRPVVGALSLGEIGNAASGYPLFHNATLVAASW